MTATTISRVGSPEEHVERVSRGKQLTTMQPKAPFEASAHALDSLAAYYHEERMWVYRTRASLEETRASLTVTMSVDTVESPDSLSSPCLPESTGGTAELSPSLSTISSTSLPHSPKMSAVRDESPSSRSPHSSSSHTARKISSTKLQKRKKDLKLNLHDIVIKSKRPLQVRANPSTAGPTPHESSVHILELYESMMESRMESCQRITKLLKNVNTHKSKSHLPRLIIPGKLKMRETS